jgi:hypothetical protein
MIQQPLDNISVSSVVSVNRRSKPNLIIKFWFIIFTHRISFSNSVLVYSVLVSLVSVLVFGFGA